jgi:hypothetical protein
MNQGPVHWTFVGISQPNDSEGIFASANSKVCFKPPEIFSEAQNVGPMKAGVLAPKSQNFKVRE